MMRGAVVGYLAFLVILPLLALVQAGLGDGPGVVWKAVSAPLARHAIGLSLWTAALATLINAVAGTATAWVLVRFDFPGRRLLSALIDLPFAIPTLVTGVTLVLLFAPTRPLGAWLGGHGWTVLYAPTAIVLALTFVTVPFVVRAVEPVLRELDPAEEEAAYTLGARPFVVWRRVVLPKIAPAVTAGGLQAFSRCLAEFGSIVVVAGNIPFRTLTGPVYVFGEVESGRPDVAAAVSVALLALALSLSYTARALHRRSTAGRRHV
ncbi:MAG: ABC transporter permease subunit [Gemmatimonadaceae bacterium]